MYGCIAAGQGKIVQVGHTLEILIGRQHHLATPNRPIRAITCAVKAEADDGLIAAMTVFCHQRGEMRVMVLHPHQARTAAAARDLFGQLGRVIGGVKVTGNHLRFDVKQPLHVFHCAPKALLRKTGGL